MLYLVSINLIFIFFFFFFNDTATTEIYTLSLHDALPIYFPQRRTIEVPVGCENRGAEPLDQPLERGLPGLDDLARDLVADRKSTRLNSSHSQISYAVFCLKKKKSETKDLSVSGTRVGEPS